MPNPDYRLEFVQYISNPKGYQPFDAPRYPSYDPLGSIHYRDVQRHPGISRWYCPPIMPNMKFENNKPICCNDDNKCCARLEPGPGRPRCPRPSIKIEEGFGNPKSNLNLLFMVAILILFVLCFFKN